MSNDTFLQSNYKANSPGAGLHEDTLGGIVKAGVAKLLALELVRGNGKEHRCINRYMPWLLNPPTTIQQGPREFLECVSHIRLLSWLLLGALQHTALLISSNANGPLSNSAVTNPCLPLPFDVSCRVADHVQGILAGFAEQSKASVHHMSPLYHTFLLCQLWTIYLEFVAVQLSSEQQNTVFNILVDFWSKITPSILQLVTHSSTVRITPTVFQLEILTDEILRRTVSRDGQATLPQLNGGADRMQINNTVHAASAVEPGTTHASGRGIRLGKHSNHLVFTFPSASFTKHLLYVSHLTGTASEPLEIATPGLHGGIPAQHLAPRIRHSARRLAAALAPEITVQNGVNRSL